jgi:hypothetical protein
MVHIRNDEPVPGLLGLNYSIGNSKKGGETVWNSSEPTHIAGNESMEIGIISTIPPQELYLSPFLSLNRHETRLALPDVDTETRLSAEPFIGSRPSDWMPAQDLDEGFSIVSDTVNGNAGDGTPRQFRGMELELDQGLPAANVMFGLPSVWSRPEKPFCWGKYRQIYAP